MIRHYYKVIYSSYLNSNFIKNVFKYLTGTTISQIILIVSTPFFSLFYNSSELGNFAYLISISTPLALISCFAYHLSIMLPNRTKDSFQLVVFSSLLSVLFSLFIFLILIICQFLNFSILTKFSLNIYYIPILMFSLIENEILKMFFIKHQCYSNISKSQIILAIVTVLITILWGYLFDSYLGLVLGTIIGQISSIVYLLYNLHRIVNFREVNLNKMIYLSKRYFKNSLYQTPSYLINNITSYLPTFFISNYFGTNIMGQYYLADRVIRSPLGMISTAFSNVLYEHLSKIKKNFISSEIRSKVAKLLLFTSIIIVLYYIIGEKIFFIFFKRNDWNDAFQLSLIVITFVGIQIPLANYCIGFRVLEENRIYFVWELTRFIILLCTLYLAHIYTIRVYLYIYGFALICCYVLLIIIFMKTITKLKLNEKC